MPADGLVVPGDAVRLGQACDNLVSNAVKFTPSGGRVTLALRSAWQTPDGEVTTVERPGAAPVAQLSVRDTGMGIPAGEQGKLFTRFFRASTAQRNAVPGVGLGLTITKAITTAHGGTLDVVSAEGEGTTFTLTLPCSARHRGQVPPSCALSRFVAAARTPPGPTRDSPRRSRTLRGSRPTPLVRMRFLFTFLAEALRIAGGSPAVGPPESFLSPGKPDDSDRTQEMQDMSTNTPLVERSTTRKVVGSLAILGTAAAVAGLGTYGNFTDSTTPLNTTVDTGTLSINLAQPGGAVAIPLNTTGFVPGDSMTRAVNLINDGGSGLGSVTVTSALTSPANVLTTDVVNGLQLTVKGCSVAWTQGGTPTAPTYTCAGTERTVLNGPAVNSAPLASPASLAAGGVDNLVFSISLPATADNTFQGKSASLSLTFTGVQRTGIAR